MDASLTDRLELSLSVAGEPHAAHLITMSSLRAIVAIPDLEALDDGTPVRLRFRAERLGQPVEVEGQTYHPPSSRSPTWLGVVFASWADPRGWSRLERLSNRRERIRVEPSTVIDTRIRTPRHKGLVHGVVRDLSVSGLGLDISPERAASLPIGEVVRVEATIDGVPMRLEATVRHHQTASDRRFTRVGVRLMHLSPTESRTLTRVVMRDQRGRRRDRR